MHFEYLRCPECHRTLAVGPRNFIPRHDEDDVGCWFCEYQGQMHWKDCGGEGKRAVVLDMMEAEWD